MYPNSIFKNLYPYTDLHELNLDWIIKQVLTLDETVKTFLRDNTITLADPITWNKSNRYKKAVIVEGPEGNSYLSLKDVPVGVDISDTEYWVRVANFNAQLEYLIATLNKIKLYGATPEMFGAKGDGVTDDTDAIQAAIDFSNTVYFMNKTYMIDAEKSVRPRSGSSLILAPGTILKAIPNNLDYYKVIYLSKVNDVLITGGSVYGERTAHLTTTGESGHCINIRDCKNITVDGVTCKYAWGDGIFVGGDEIVPENINILNCDISLCRRQGISIIKGETLKVDNCFIHDISGTAPSDCIDIEPNFENEYVRNCIISNCKFKGLVESHLNASKVANDIEIVNCNGGAYAATFTATCVNSVVKIVDVNAEARYGSFNLQNASNSCEVYIINCTSRADRTPQSEWESGLYFAGDNYNIFVDNLLLTGKTFHRYIQHSALTPVTLHNCSINIKLLNTAANNNVGGYSQDDVFIAILTIIKITLL